MRVHNLGSINLDHVYRVPHLVMPGETLASRELITVLGGKGANQSVALARAGTAVRHVGRLNAADAWVLADLEASGVDVSGIEMVDEPSGHAIIQVDDHGENAIVLLGGANQGFSASSLELSLDTAEKGDWLLMQNECNELGTAFELAASLGLRIAFNPAPMSEAAAALPLAQCDLLIVNEVEAMQLTETADAESAIDAMQRRFPESQIVVTLGQDGACWMRAGDRHDQPAMLVDVVDTTGAGDTFVGYFLAATLSNLPVRDALRRASAAAALAVGQQGASPSIPSASAVTEFLNSVN